MPTTYTKSQVRAARTSQLPFCHSVTFPLSGESLFEAPFILLSEHLEINCSEHLCFYAKLLRMPLLNKKKINEAELWFLDSASLVLVPYICKKFLIILLGYENIIYVLQFATIFLPKCVI